MATSTTISVSLVPLLDSGNYDIWTSKMHMYLVRERLWNIVCKHRTRPTGGSTTNPTAEQTQWDNDAEQVTATIFLYLSDMAE